MMFSSIRGRLWLSYVAVIVLALSIVAAVLAAFLIRNPYTYRQAAVRITAAENLLDQEAAAASRTAVVAEGLGVRILTLAPNGAIRSDTSPAEGSFRKFSPERALRQITVMRDLDGHLWLYSSRRIAGGDWQIVATRRPGVLPVLNVVRDELWRPLIQGGLVALLLALALAFWLARWIADPVQSLVRAARATSGAGVQTSKAASPPPEVSEAGSDGGGPIEVRELTRAFHGMLERVAASQRSQKAFVANVSHELKTPLTAIEGFSQALLDGTAETEESRRLAAETIHREARRMYRLATDLLDLARLDSGIVAMRSDVVDVGAILEGLRERFEPIAAMAGVGLEARSTPNLPSVVGDGDQLAQAFGNIVDNAIKFTPAGGAVSLQADAVPGEVRVVIRDTGQGIPLDDLEHIFDRFYQVEPSRGGVTGRGSGLGLAIAREVVEGHGGKIHVRSALGRGAEFSVHLPLRAGSRDVQGAD